jgi:chemotaxis methyl-accepting protein methylase
MQKMSEQTLHKVLRIEIAGKSPVGGFLRVNEWLWKRLLPSLTNLYLIRLYGHFLNALVRRYTDRTQFFGTFFLRNRSQLELICRLSYLAEQASALNMAVLGCSNGAEVYSILAVLRQARPELKVTTHAVDISSEVLAIAKSGSYSITAPELVGEAIFQRLTDAELQQMFDRNADQLTIRPWIREGIIWNVGDVRDSQVLNLLGLQDVVVANNFLCHMQPADAGECLRGIARLVRPGGYLVVSGIDLEVRKKTALDQGWTPVTDLLEEVHNGDTALRKDWPLNYWGLEPFDKNSEDWVHRYAAVFQIGDAAQPRNPSLVPTRGHGAESTLAATYSTPRN